jgi:hypothetical protein
MKSYCSLVKSRSLFFLYVDFSIPCYYTTTTRTTTGQSLDTMALRCLNVTNENRGWTTTKRTNHPNGTIHMCVCGWKMLWDVTYLVPMDPIRWETKQTKQSTETRRVCTYFLPLQILQQLIILIIIYIYIFSFKIPPDLI